MASPSRFDKDGYVTYASPRLLRFCAVVWYRSMKNDNRMPSHSIFPVVFSGEPSSLMAREDHASGHTHSLAESTGAESTSGGLGGGDWIPR